jgi:glycosyltransferase involved in cell wall biosynthesis
MYTLTVVIPAYNEETTLAKCIERVQELEDDDLKLQIIIVDDASVDNTYQLASNLKKVYSNVEVFFHEKNKGKGAALRTGFQKAKGDFVVVQDADLEYNPLEIRRLLRPLIDGHADVVYGSRFFTTGPHRVMYYWHSLGNRFLTELSNMFTDLNLTDMETCYKVFRREIIQDIDLKENRFGFEPEITAKIAQKRCRVYEMGVSYAGRTYEEGKKIGWKDGLRAVYCIIKYNAHVAPLPIQLFIYLFIGGSSALLNLLLFLAMYNSGVVVDLAAPVAFILAAAFNYYLSTILLFRRNVRWGKFSEIMIYSLVVVSIALVDLYLTKSFIWMGLGAGIAKIYATIMAFILNFLARKYIIFPEKGLGPWQSQMVKGSATKEPVDNRN